MTDEIRATVDPDAGATVTVVQTEVPHVVRVGEQGPPGSGGDLRLLDLADVDSDGNPANVSNGSLLIFDAVIQKFKLLTVVEQDQCINGGYF